MITEQKEKVQKTLEKLIKKHPSLRAFARHINEDASDICRWKSGRTIRTRSIINIIQYYPEIMPHELDPENYPENLHFIFKGKK